MRIKETRQHKLMYFFCWFISAHRAIVSCCGTILLKYFRDKLFPVSGSTKVLFVALWRRYLCILDNLLWRLSFARQNYKMCIVKKFWSYTKIIFPKFSLKRCEVYVLLRMEIKEAVSSGQYWWRTCVLRALNCRLLGENLPVICPLVKSFIDKFKYLINFLNHKQHKLSDHIFVEPFIH